MNHHCVNLKIGENKFTVEPVSGAVTLGEWPSDRLIQVAHNTCQTQKSLS